MTAASVALYNRWRDLMRSWGFTVLEAAGCDTQSASSRAVDPSGLFLEHHDASSALSGNWGLLATILAGRSDVPPRLANLQFARDGQVMITCKNVANHGGLGGPLLGIPANDVNVHSCGAEVANNGLGETYSPALTKALVHGEAAWAIVCGRTHDYVRGHKEWAPKRKIDPLVDMNARRAQVAAVIANRGPLPGDLEDDMAQKDIDEIQRKLSLLLSVELTPRDPREKTPGQQVMETPVDLPGVGVANFGSLFPELFGNSRAALTALAALRSGGTADPQAIVDLLRPMLTEAVQAGLAADNDAQADEIVDQLVARLAS